MPSLSANTCSKISAVIRGLSHTVVNHCLFFDVRRHHTSQVWNVSISVRKIDRKSSPSSTVSSLTKVCDMPRHLRLGLPSVNRESGGFCGFSVGATGPSLTQCGLNSPHVTRYSLLVMRSTRHTHTVNSSHMRLVTQ